MKLRLTLAATGAVLAFSSIAAAQQPWLADRRYGEGIGIRSGNFEFHPSISTEFGYDSNYFQRAETEEPVLDAWRLRVTPSLTLSTLKPSFDRYSVTSSTMSGSSSTTSARRMGAKLMGIC